ncbi:MAG: UrcA family protein [Pseudomonadota bacterium]
MKANIVKAVSAIVLGVGFIASAIAAPHSLYEDVTVKVSYEDLNITKEAGARVLYQRLKHATAEVCDMSSFSRDRSLSRVGDAKECYKETLTKAVQKVNSPALTKIHNS